MFRLKLDQTFQKLNKLQSQLDDTDSALKDANFTRSPYQVLSFLIAYAGLNDSNKKTVITNLNSLFNHQSTDEEKKGEESQLFTRKELDDLIEKIHWEEIINNIQNSPLEFQLKVQVPDRAAFLKGIESYVKNPSLLTTLKANPGIIQAHNKENEIVFTTKVRQKVAWEKKFQKEGPYWNVPHFEVSEKLQRQIDEMEPGTSRKIGAFSIKKGNDRSDTPKKIKLRIKAPLEKDYYCKEVGNTKVDSGICGAFLGVTRVYGLSQIDRVEVELSNTAIFSETGALAHQKSRLKCMAESGEFISEECDPLEIIITIEDLFVYYKGIDVLVKNLSEEKKKEEYTDVDTDVNIALGTKNKAFEDVLGIVLHPSKLASSQVHDVNFSEKVIKKIKGFGEDFIKRFLKLEVEDGLKLKPTSRFCMPVTRLERFFKHAKEKIYPVGEPKTEQLFNLSKDVEDDLCSLSKLRDPKKAIPSEILDQIERLLLNMVELGREEISLNYKNLSTKLETCMENLIVSIDLFAENRDRFKDSLLKDLMDLQKVGEELDARNKARQKESLTVDRLIYHVKTLFWSVITWTCRLGVVLGAVGAGAGAIAGALGASAGAAILSSPVGSIATPLGTASGAVGGLVVGSIAGGTVGVVGGLIFGLFAGFRKIVLSQDEITQDSANNLVNKVDKWIKKVSPSN